MADAPRRQLRIRPLGDSIDYPAAVNTVYSGYVDAAVAAEQLPAGWSVTNDAVGQYTVTHNLGLASANDLSITLNVISAAPDDRIIVVSPGTNSFTLFIDDAGSGAVDAPFFFMAKRNV